MPKGKKKFIDRKNAVTFHVVHRSQQDPLINDEDAPQHVLLRSTGKSSKTDEEQRKAEQKEWGISYDDDYNYLQHMRSTSDECEGELVRYRIMASEPPVTKPQENKVVRLKLPSSVFASSVEEEVGVLNLAAPHPGPRLDLDPDVVAAMDEDFDYTDPDNMLDDDFIQLANAGSGGDSADHNGLDSIAEDDDDLSSDGDVSSDDVSEDDEVGSLKGSEFSFAEEETKSRFTNYSVSSSVIRRNEHLELLDNRFEQMFAGYDDSEIGALDCEEIDGYIPPDSDVMLQCAEQFSREQASQKHEADTSMKDFDVVLSSDEDDDMVDLEVHDDKEDRLDCESILSTYSNLYNHPKLITEPVVPRRIQVSARTGMPVGVLDSGQKLTTKALAKLNAMSLGLRAMDKDGTESVISTLSVLSVRPKDETPEGRRERKKALKDYRKDRRLEKKANTLAFKEEKKRQEKIVLNTKANLQTARIL